MKFRIPRDFSQLNSTSDFGDRYRALRGQSEFTRTAANNYTSDIDDAGDAGSYSSKQNPPSSSLSNGSGRNASRKSYIDQINEENEDDASAASGGRSAADRKKDGGLPTTDEKKRRQQQRAGEDAERKKRDDDERRERERREREENERVKQLESELINDAKTAAVDTTPLKDARVIFLVGGPGSGKVSAILFFPKFPLVSFFILFRNIKRVHNARKYRKITAMCICRAATCCAPRCSRARSAAPS